MKRLLSLLLVGAVAACGGDGASSGELSSGIRGRALAGPQCPVEVEGSPCPDVPYEGVVIAIEVGSGREHTVRTDEVGRFELPLEPGTYEVSILAESSPPFAKPRTVSVVAGSFTEITVAVDTGIR